MHFDFVCGRRTRAVACLDRGHDDTGGGGRRVFVCGRLVAIDLACFLGFGHTHSTARGEERLDLGTHAVGVDPGLLAVYASGKAGLHQLHLVLIEREGLNATAENLADSKDDLVIVGLRRSGGRCGSGRIGSGGQGAQQ